MGQAGRDAVTPLEAAREYVRRGWCVVPIPFKQKKAVIKGWEQLRLTEADLPQYFDQPANIGIILGEPSGWLVDVDLDCPEAIDLAEQYLPPTGAKSGRPGAVDSHWWYYAPATVTEKHTDPVSHKMIVELRATGLQTVVGPSIHPDDGSEYEILRGEPATVPAPMLAACVAALAKAVIERRHGNTDPVAASGNGRTDVVARTGSHSDRITRHLSSTDVERRALAYLDKLPPAISGQGGHATTYTAATVLVHGFEIDPEQALGILLDHYNPRCEPPWTEKELRHKVEDAARKPHDQPRGWLLNQEREQPVDLGVDISTLVGQATEITKPASLELAVTDTDSAAISDPGPVPDELLHIPGFVDDVMQFTLKSVKYPNRPMSFMGAIALLGALTGRKIREPGNVRTNVQILALASSGVGKDGPRKVNASILLHAGEVRKLGGKSSSGEGIEDRLARHPIVLKQDDEIDTLFENMRDNKEARYRNQFGMLLELFGEAGGWRPIRDKAGQESDVIYQPHLVLFGTTTPGEFYASLSGKMLNKGLLARLITVEAGERSDRHKAAVWNEPPQHIIEAAKAWSEFRPPGWGNVSDQSNGHAVPLIVPFTREAQDTLDAFADDCDAAYKAAAQSGSEPIMAIWARAVEKATQLALIYACSMHGTEPVIELPAVTWASTFIRHTVHRTIYMLGQHFHESEFEQKCQAVLATLAVWHKQNGDEWMPYHLITRKHRWPPREHEAIREALVDQRLIEVNVVKTSGRPGFVYRLQRLASSGPE
ncbi:MAG: bifunctional DNA primase/polymerase [Planctomycetaceae bacterium]|nr:bifunctional DNA primase/polymerase [Planctomycetaceae bacterium]